MPSEPYLSLMKQKKPIFDSRDLKIYDFTPELGTYVYRDLKEKKYTPIDKTLVTKCKAEIVKYLSGEFRGQSEFVKCLKGCGQPWKGFLVATFLLWKIDRKIKLFGSNRKTYLRLTVKKKRRLEELDENISSFKDGMKAIQVLDAKSVNWLEKIHKEQRKRTLAEYKQYRETYG